MAFFSQSWCWIQLKGKLAGRVPPSCWSLPWGRWKSPALASGMCVLGALQPPESQVSPGSWGCIQLLPLFPADPWPEAWRIPSAVWVWGCSSTLGWGLCSWSLYPSLLSLCTVPNRKAGQPCVVRHNLCLHCWLHSLNSLLNFILKNLERNQVPSDAEISIFIGTSSPRNSVVTTRSVAVSGFWKALSGAIQAWILSHVGSSLGRRLPVITKMKV